jgi:hypothetical protein
MDTLAGYNREVYATFRLYLSKGCHIYVWYNRIIKMTHLPPYAKIKHAVHLQRLFDTKREGFSKTDLRHIVRSDSIYNLINRTQSNHKKPWNPSFIWQVTEFPEIYGEYTGEIGEEEKDDTLLAIAKDAEFCAVITMSNDFKCIWYRMYRTNMNNHEDFGSLMYAYTQLATEFDTFSSIFVSFAEHYGLEPKRGTGWGGKSKRMSPDDAKKINGHPYTKIYIEKQVYEKSFDDIQMIENHDLQTYTASSVHVYDNADHPDDISFYDKPSEDTFRMDDVDPRYHHLFSYNRFGGWTLLPDKLIGDCMHRPTQQTPWILASDVLHTDFALVQRVTDKLYEQLRDLH